MKLRPCITPTRTAHACSNGDKNDSISLLCMVRPSVYGPTCATSSGRALLGLCELKVCDSLRVSLDLMSLMFLPMGQLDV